jgi:hypothetical protein
MNGCKFNDVTYIDILRDVLTKKKIKLDKFFKSLSKERCYTFNIKHHSIHKFDNLNGVNDNIWFIQSVLINYVDQTNASYESTDILGIEYISEIKKPEAIDISQYSKNILNTTNEKSTTEYLHNKKINLGYILKSKNTKLTQIHSNILIESNLMRKIRNLMYNSKFIKISNECNIKKNEITAISAYLNINDNIIFIQLFPEYKYLYNILNQITDNQVNKVIQYYNKQNLLNINDISDNNTNNRDCDKITLFLYNSINRLYNVNMINPIYLKQVISNYLINESNLSLYVRLYKETYQ